MGVLSNPRHERFAQELAKGKSATEAYEVAGYKPDRGAASRLSAKINVQGRLAELLSKSAAKAELTVETLIEEAEAARAKAMAEDRGASAAVAAVMAKGRLAGLIVDKREDVTPRRSLDQIDARIRQLIGDGGERGVDRTPGGSPAGAERDATVPTVPGHGTA